MRLCHRLIAFSIAGRGQAPKKVHQEIYEEGVQTDLTLVRATPSAAPAARTMPQRIVRLEEEFHGLRESLKEQRVVLDAMTRDFFRLTTWTVGRLSQLLDASGITYMRYDDNQIPYQRRTRRRTDRANTSAAPRTDNQPDP
ncbi:hypothetical protein Tco_0136364 [Tanacetum coccineum]